MHLLSPKNALAAALVVAIPTVMLACGDDDDVAPGGTGGSSTSTSTSTSTTSSSTSSTGTGGEKPVEEVSGSITEDTTFTSDSDWLLQGIVRVEPGATLTIEPGTTIMGETSSLGTLLIKNGAQIEAAGTAEQPIVFTSQLPPGQRAAGDWGGLVILGNAPINEPGGTAAIEGFTTDESYGGNDPGDSSGTLQYVRIEFSGIEISTDNEINGLTMGGVGDGTTIDHIMVRHTLDDCFEWFGGTVNASHLICYRNGDDGFDFDEGYIGNLQFLVLHQNPQTADDPNGFEGDNDKDAPDSTPLTHPTIYNVTLCGQNEDVPKQQYGFVFRRGFNATIGNAIVMGFEAGRLFQLENPDAPIDDPVGAYAPENATPQAPGTPALVSRDGQRLGCGACRQLLGDVADGLPTICPRCGAPTAPPEGWTVEG